MRRRAFMGLALAAAGCTPADRAPMPAVTIAAGPQGSVYYELGKAFADEVRQAWRVPVEVYRSDESVDNLRTVAEGRADVGFATVDTCKAALQADSLFTGVLPIAALSGLYEDYLQLLVKDNSTIKMISHLKGKRVVAGKQGSGTEMLVRRVLFAADFTLDDVVRHFQPISEAADYILNGQLDALFLLGGLDTPAVSQLTGKIRLIPMATEVGKLQANYGDSYLRRSIPAGTFGLADEVVTVGLGNVLFVHSGLSEEAAFGLTRLLFAARPRLAQANREARRIDTRSAIATFGIPLHNGAKRYYRESKPFVMP